jgi:hypothetical protein
MTDYLKIIENFEKKVASWKKDNPNLKESIIEINSAEKKRTEYEVINSVVFNEDLRKIGKKGPKYILVADNPGMEEQKQSRYLVGLSGKMARNFFHVHGLVNDFESEVAVLNKSCIHTHSTRDLKKLKKYKDLSDQSQKVMADMLVDVQKLYNCDIWVIGCSELKRKGLFEIYLERLRKRYSEDAADLKNRIFFYPHFSYGNFNRNLNVILKDEPELGIKDALKKAGKEIL